jgi:pimeloyl-ACP methyl ester carboxylesterase
VSDGGVLALLLAATHPDRVAGVVTYAAYPVFVPPQAADCGHSSEFLSLLAATADHRFVLDLPLLDQIVQVLAPSRAGDHGFIRWLGRYSRLSAGPGATAAAFVAMRGIDIRHVLAHVGVPTVVLHRAGDRALPLANARYLAEHLPHARSVELPGDDHIIWAGDVDVIADHVERFLTDPAVATRR